MLIVLGLLIGSTLTFGQPKSTRPTDSDENQSKIEIFSYGQDVHVKAEGKGVIVITNLSTGISSTYQVEGSETVITVKDNGIYQVGVVAGGKSEGKKVAIVQ